MSRTSDPSPPDVKALWKPILALSTWIAITFCANFSFAIKLSSVSDLDSTVLACANVLVALITGFITLFAYRASERKARSFWTRLALVGGALFLLAFFSFMILRSLWTCQYTQSTPGDRPVTDSGPVELPGNIRREHPHARGCWPTTPG
jgi:RsiW-degrading membrane proteinase PrsW (M82 family)